MKKKEPLDSLLDRWEAPDRQDDGLVEKVWDRISDVEASLRDERERSRWWGNLWSRPAYAMGSAAALVVCGFALGVLVPDNGTRVETSSVDTVYRLSIDPLMRLETEPEIQSKSASLRAPATLRWLRDELQLDPNQFEKVVLLHSLYESDFEKLFGAMAENKSKFQEIEERRFKDEVIDFFSVHELAKQQEDLEKTSDELRSELLVKLEEVMGPEQWERYQSLVKSKSSSGTTEKTDV